MSRLLLVSNCSCLGDMPVHHLLSSFAISFLVLGLPSLFVAPMKLHKSVTRHNWSRHSSYLYM